MVVELTAPLFIFENDFLIHPGASGLPVNPSWTRERPYLTRDFIFVSKAEEPVSKVRKEWQITLHTMHHGSRLLRNA